MIILNSVELTNFCSVKGGTLKGFKSLNIIYGPNNCGKTSFLKSISLLNTLNISPSINFSSIEKSRLLGGWNSGLERKEYPLCGIQLALNSEQVYLKGKRNLKIRYELNKDLINEVVKRSSLPFEPDQFTSLIRHVYPKKSIDLNEEFKEEEFYSINLEKEGAQNYALAANVSLLNFLETGTKLQNVIFCDDLRIDSYKGTSLTDYITKKRLSGEQARKLISFIKDIIDPNIIDYKPPFNLLKSELSDFESTIQEQGSGVRSLICLATDILFAQNSSIIIIDEPELGLNPNVKQKFLKFLSNQSKKKQVFIATHDPTFLNPLLLENQEVALFQYSSHHKKFVMIDLQDIKKSRNTFGGYLPHTTSTRKTHIYVEGWIDVLVIQSFLIKYLKEKCGDDWLEPFNKISVFHLGGDYLQHIVHTIPPSPYKKIIILDGDKSETSDGLIEKLNNSKSDCSVEFRHRKQSQQHFLKDDIHSRFFCPIWCLKEKRIEKYLDPYPTKKRDGPAIAEKMEKVPDEFKMLFENIIE